MVQKVKVELLPDDPVDKDAFGGHKRIADAIGELVEGEDGGKAIALEGGWGSGKSSIVRMLERKFDTGTCTANDEGPATNASGQVKQQDSKRAGRSSDTRMLVFDAWSHDGDPLRRVFLEQLTGLCTAEFDQPRKDYWENRKKKEITGLEIERDQRTTPVLKSKWPILALAFASLFPVAIVVLGALLNQDNPDTWMLTLVVTCVLISVTPFLSLFVLFVYLCIDRSRAGLRAAGSLISLWSKKIDETTSTTAHETTGPTSIEFQNFFSDLVKEYLSKPNRRLVIVLDNLDRVPESTARTLWATLRLFADCCDNNEEWSKRTWFVVPYDREAAAKLWNKVPKDRIRTAKRPIDDVADNADESKAAEPTEKKPDKTNVRTNPHPPSVPAAFLDKTFQIRFVVPPLHIADWEEYLNGLVKRAMSGIGTIEELHRVYRVSERLSDEKGRPPSPRHLKLYVNDIGAIIRQFGTRFPIDHLAIFTILRRQGWDIPLWITSGEFKRSPLANVMPDDKFTTSLLCIYYGTKEELAALTLTLGGPLRQHLRNGDGDGVKELAEVPGFWNAAETELEKELEADEVKQEVVVQMATALDVSGVHKSAPANYAHVIPAFAKEALVSADWQQLNNEAAGAADILLRIAGDPDATNITFSRLVSGEPERPSVATDSKSWALGTAMLVETARSLGHDYRVVIPGDAAQTVACLASIGKGKRGQYVLDRLSCKCAVSEVQAEVKPTAGDAWTQGKANALKTLRSTPNISMNWKDLVAPFSTRLRADALEIAEAMLLLDAFFDLGDHAPGRMKTASADIANQPSFYVHVGQWSKDPVAVAFLVALQVLSGTVGREAKDPEKQGHAFLQTLFSSPDDQQAIVEKFLAIVLGRPKLAIVSHFVDQHSALGAFFIAVLTKLAKREDVANALPLSVYLDHFAVVKKQLGEAFPSLASNLLKSEEFKRDLARNKITPPHAGAHCELIQAGAFENDAYLKNVSNFLNEVDVETWEQEILKASDMYSLLVLAFSRGWTATFHLEEAVEKLGLGWCSEEPPKASWKGAPPNWKHVYDNLHAERRGTAANKIVDSLKHRVPDDLHPLVALFDDDFARAFAEGNGDALVRQVADPIIKNGDQVLIGWLHAAIRHGQKFWETAPNDDRSTFAQSLWQRVNSDECDEIKDCLRQIAHLLDLPEPEPVEEENAEEPEQAENEDADG